MATVGSIRCVNENPAFKSKRVTKEGNIYDKTNVGKITGSAVGATYGGVQVYRVAKFMNENEPLIKQFVEDCLKSIESIDKNTVDGLLSAAEERTAAFNKGMKIGKVAVASVAILATALVGLGVGALADFGINKYKAHKADKVAKINENVPVGDV